MALSYFSYLMNWDAFQTSSPNLHYHHRQLSETSYHEFSQGFSDTTIPHLPHSSIGSTGTFADGVYYSSQNYDFLSPSPPPLQYYDVIDNDHSLVKNCYNFMITGGSGAGTDDDYQQQQPPFPEFGCFGSCGYSYELEAASCNSTYEEGDHVMSTCTISPLPHFDQTAQPLHYSNGTTTTTMKKSSLSAQSIAARQRRRKISDKTQELGKLIPGGQKMNTADMFHAAYKYIKFLQAQVGILQFMDSLHDDQPQQENDEHPSAISEIGNEMHGLVGSALVQEKLMCAEKCLVPQKLVESLHKSNDKYFFETNMASQILEEVRQLIIIS